MRVVLQNKQAMSDRGERQKEELVHTKHDTTRNDTAQKTNKRERDGGDGREVL